MPKRKDITGQQFYWLKAIEPTAKREAGAECEQGIKLLKEVRAARALIREAKGKGDA